MPPAFAGRFVRAALLITARQFEAALREVELALQLDPYSPSVADDATSAFYNVRDYDRVIRHALTQTDKYPNNPNFYLWLGAAYAQLEEFDNAIRNSLKAVELESNPLTVAFLGGSYGAAGQRDKAMETLEERLLLTANLTYDYSALDVGQIGCQ